ncbi:hypothetical protein [Thioclava sp. GXIMD4215]|uniref:hypothetical protein n=1 Tax=Thioclava sp. GXIMD4215 TaxID=3131928 RepID=UPI0032499AB1
MKTNFQRIMDDDPEVANRFAALADTVIQEFAAMGVQITADELQENRSLKLASITPEAGFNLDACCEEARKNPLIGKRVYTRDIRDKLESGAEDLSGWSRYQRMELGREIEKNKKAELPLVEKVDPDTHAQRLRILREIGDPQARINLARKWDMV